NTGAGFHFHNPVNVIVSGNISGNDDSEYPNQVGKIIAKGHGQSHGYAFLASDEISHGSVIFQNNLAIDNTTTPVSFSPSGSESDIFAHYGPNIFQGPNSDFEGDSRERWAQSGVRIFTGNGPPPLATSGTFKRGDIVLNQSPYLTGEAGSQYTAI